MKGRTLEAIFKRDGKEVGIRKNTLSPDGRTMTVTVEGTTTEGQKYLSGHCQVNLATGHVGIVGSLESVL
jgi:hypothetical protein